MKFQAIVAIFRRTLQNVARIWIEGKQFNDIQGLQNSFIGRFSPSSTHYALAKQFRDITYNTGDTGPFPSG